MQSTLHSDAANRIPQAADGAHGLRFRAVRRLTETLCSPLAVEDYVAQSMPDASPAKWHLAHATWFFETFVLSRAWPDDAPFHPGYGYLFNSYYNAIGDRVPRPQRGLLTRPTVEDVYRYRAHVDERMEHLLADAELTARLGPIIELGLHHEQQHQELLLTDIKHLFSLNPLRPAYHSHAQVSLVRPPRLRWHTYPAALHWIGHSGAGFAFDNELPRHRVYADEFQLASRLVTNAEYQAFIDDHGYGRPEYWLSDGWDASRAQRWQAPLYWEQHHGRWHTMSLSGFGAVNPDEPVTHVSYYEADAFARWSEARLPTETEWEIAAAVQPVEGNLLAEGLMHPRPLVPDAQNPTAPAQLFGDVWEWTSSSYAPYPGYAPAAGALGEYNGKFMCNQFVLRGGSCATPPLHVRPTYLNFFPPSARWQFSGIRLARDP